MGAMVLASAPLVAAAVFVVASELWKQVLFTLIAGLVLFVAGSTDRATAFYQIVLILEGTFLLVIGYWCRVLYSTDHWAPATLFGSNTHASIIFGSQMLSMGLMVLLTLGLRADMRVALLVTSFYHMSCCAMYVIDEGTPFDKKAPKHYFLVLCNLVGALVACMIAPRKMKNA